MTTTVAKLVCSIPNIDGAKLESMMLASVFLCFLCLVLDLPEQFRYVLTSSSYIGNKRETYYKHHD
jgi:hypothetical protein